MNNSQRYIQKHKIGSGGMATVFLAEDTVLHRDVALKVLHDHLLSNNETITRFRNEARAIATLSHENIIKVYDYGEGDGKQFLVMEYIDGQTLDALRERTATIPNLVLLEILMQVFAGLQAAHAKGICHRDIKSSNIIIDRPGRIRIMDFGIAFLVNQQSLTTTGMFVGSPSHIAPEQVDGRQCTGKADVFSTGIMAYECLTGDLPFKGDNPLSVIKAIMTFDPPLSCMCHEKNLAWVSEFIGKCLIKNPAQRPDANWCIESIAGWLKDYELTLGNQRIRDFVADPQAYRRMENQEIFEAFRKKGLSAYKSRNMTLAMKSWHQAQAFGLLGKLEDRLLSKARQDRRFKRVVGYAALGVAVVLLGIFIAVGISHSKFIQRNGTADTEIAIHPVSHIDTKPTQSADSGGNTGERPLPAIPPAKPGVRKTWPHPVEPVGAVESRAAPGYVYVYSNPPWATIAVDGIEYGETPRKEPIALSAGIHLLRLDKNGYKAFVDSINVVSVDTIIVRTRLESPLDMP
jgi:serine/threonine protein kinase